jgi:hypothetical protein
LVDTKANSKLKPDIIVKNKILMVALVSTAAYRVGCSKEGTTSDKLDQDQAKTGAAAQDI